MTLQEALHEPEVPGGEKMRAQNRKRGAVSRIPATRAGHRRKAGHLPGLSRFQGLYFSLCPYPD